jgi:hypothetical protein
MTPLDTRESNPDDDLRGWQEAEAEDAMKQAQNLPFHLCPIDMPPCPICEQIYDDEDANM